MRVRSLEGPSEFQLVPSNEGELRYGKFYASVPEPARGFKVDPDDFEVVNYGAEFGFWLPKGGEFAEGGAGSVQVDRGFWGSHYSYYVRIAS